MQKNIPRSIGIIMDGNRRWAKAKSLPVFQGHRAGYDKLKEVADWCIEAGVRYLTVYAFSTENWNRSVEEVGYLMNLFRTMVDSLIADAQKRNTRLIFLGERARLDADIRASIEKAEEVTRTNDSFVFGIALSYGGRAEIIDAIRRIPKEDVSAITEEGFSQLLWTKEIPDPDLVLRTSGEERLSNFLPWQSVYSELFFTKTLWPDLSREEFEKILAEYAERDRRRGK